MEFTNDFKALGPAGDSLVVNGQREVVTAAVSRVMFCMVTKKLLDQKTTVVLMGEKYTLAVDAAVWDAQQDDVVAAVAAHSGKIEVYDGRELW